MRRIDRCTKDPDECEALEAGYSFRDDPPGYVASEVAKHLKHIAMAPPPENANDAIETLTCDWIDDPAAWEFLKTLQK